MKFVCAVCGYVYDEEKEGVSFKDLPKDWRCPFCGAPESAFEPVAEEPLSIAGNTAVQRKRYEAF